MPDIPDSERINIEKLDAKSIEKLASDLTRMLTEAAQRDPNTQAKGHFKLGHIKIGFSKSGHFEVIIGGSPEPD